LDVAGYLNYEGSTFLELITFLKTVLCFVLLLQEKTEEEEFSTGPLSVLTMSVKNNTQVCVLVSVCCIG
jgi:small nuclear ribonucleoprotein D2